MTFLTAKRKAAERLGVTDSQRPAAQHRDRRRRWPNISGCLTPDGHEQSRPQAQRRAALRAMHWLSQFEPRLVGPVLSGTATAHADIQLHLFADRPEYVTLQADRSRHRA